MDDIKVCTVFRRRNGEITPLESEMRKRRPPEEWIKPTHLDCGLDYVMERKPKPMKMESFSSFKLSKTQKLNRGGKYSTIPEYDKGLERSQIQAAIERRKQTEVVVTFDTKERINWRHGYDN